MTEEQPEKHRNPVVSFVYWIFYIIGLFIDMIVKILRNVCLCACCCCGSSILSLFLICMMLYGISVNHQDYLNGIDNGVSKLNTNLIGLAATIDTCAPMANQLTLLYNKVIKIPYALLNAIFNGLGYTYQGQPIFQWANQQIQINYWDKKYRMEKAYHDHIANTVHTYGYNSIDELPFGHQTRIRADALKAQYMQSQTISLADIQNACNIFTNIIKFLIDMLNIFNLFFVNIFGKIITALIKFFLNPNVGLPDLLFIILDFFKNFIIDAIPFGKCLKNPLSLVKCMCTPINADSITLPDVYLVGCAFSTCDASVYNSGFEAIQYCIGLRAALDQLGLFGQAVSYLLDQLNKLVDLIDDLDGTINDFIDKLEGVLNIIGRLQKTRSVSKFNNPRNNIDHAAHTNILRHISSIHRNLPIYRPPIYAPYLDQYKVNDTKPINNTIFKAVDNRTYFEKYMADKDLNDPKYGPIFGMMNDINDFMTMHIPVFYDFTNLTTMNLQIVSGVWQNLMSPDRSIEEMSLDFSDIEFRRYPFHWNRIVNHMNETQSNTTSTCDNGCADCTAAEKYLCSKTTSYTSYLQQLHDNMEENSVFFVPFKKITIDNTTEQEVRRKFQEGLDLYQQKQAQFNSFKEKNKMFDNGIGVNFNLQGSLSFLLLGGIIATMTCSNICGACCSKSMHCCSVFTSCCPLIFVILGGMVANILLNFFQNSFSNDDLISPYMLIFQADLLNLNNEQVSPQEILNQFTNVANLLQQTINNLLIKIIGWATQITIFGIPLINLPTPQQGDSVIDWILHIIFYPYFSPCSTSNDCVLGGRCYRIRDITNPNAFCTKECVVGDECDVFNGQCYILPFIRPGLCASEIFPQFSTTLQPQCYNSSISSFPVNDLKYTNGTMFKRYGYTAPYFRSSEFRGVLYATAVTFNYWILFWFRMLVIGVQIPSHGILFTFMGNLPIAVPGMNYITIITMLNHFVFPPLQSVLIDVHDFVAKVPFEPFTTIETAWKLPNWQDYPPFGKIIPAMWTCQGIYTFPAVIGGGVESLAIVVLVTIIFAPFTIVILLLLFKALWFVISRLGNKGLKIAKLKK